MNYSIFQFLNNLAEHYDWIDDLMEIFAQDIVWIMLAVLVWLWFTGKEANQKLVFFSFLSASVALLIASLIISPEVNHARPFVEHQVHQLIPHAADASFPSDHATLAFSIAFSLLWVKRKLGVVMLGLAVLTGIARVYVGVHYPGDIVGAMALSLSTSLIVFLVRGYLDSIPLFFIRIYRKITSRILHVHDK
ncbi:undecaprenyl-diphosphatase [Cohnella silvisoli]|uniref:Undecaprenyl-diphosphatase n=1 Tax=Cohnella silvisoli TaxID=2873699 RepID=A0ABV1KTN7_9BACL|nr:undecaprenyl-diphosphatase [Cohnella silvisoli]MCD9022782.1 undecaprenyl-diphosphatase [Cohnella silvisoli]